ncbi:DUF2142 domain-containing protein [Acidocella aminolytica]|jgi:hypothetical protein|uniref:DUF2142 domain-containing protein n=1 Tax=Acidocella aminolytica 101 = DSM 11237 TaxID=1120923 RepID=A0A0D6PI83_9PROT|nr:DUF2142 domain-containing protein [Acidocella aminolytica]GAN81086.1 hypothetical protein Aam_073_028 [Acidocella aminolytica 101 = DSM 11237]SHF13144.1 Predicted membrane protein [Acidocella aminolytica 101 = DSM 11237]
MQFCNADWRNSRGWTLSGLFLACALPVLVMVALLTPPGQSPDEPAHLVRANGVLHGALFLTRKPRLDAGSGKMREQVGVKIDAGLFSAGFGKTTQISGRPVVTSADEAAMQGNPWAHYKIFSNIPNTATYFPLAYLPSAFGLGVGKLFGASPYISIRLARLADAAAYLAIGAATLAVASYGRALLLGVLLLPMSLFLGGTLDQDGILVALGCLACAGLTRETRGGRTLAFAAFLVVALAKPPYLAIMAIFALPLAWPGFWRRAGEVLLASLPVLVWAVIIVAFISVPFIKPPYHPGPLFNGPAGMLMDKTDTAANLHILLADKARFLILPLHTLHLFGSNLAAQAIGALGLLQIVFPHWFYTLWWIAVGMALLGVAFCRRPAYRPLPVSVLNGAVALLVILLTTWLIAISFYLSWTNVGMDFIDGLQGRYALLLLPFLAFAMPSLSEAMPEWVPLLPVLMLGVFDIGYVPLKLVTFYYLH